MPLKIYLDSQDYYNLYKNRNVDQDIVYECLCNHVDQGNIIIIYSFPIIVEFLQDYNSDHKNDRLARVQFIKRLCKSNAFVPLERLNKVDEPLSKEGDWTPITSLIESSSNLITQPLKDYLSNLNRKLRRKTKGVNSVKDFIRSNPDFYNLKLQRIFY